MTQKQKPQKVSNVVPFPGMGPSGLIALDLTPLVSAPLQNLSAHLQSSLAWDDPTLLLRACCCAASALLSPELTEKQAVEEGWKSLEDARARGRNMVTLMGQLSRPNVP